MNYEQDRRDAAAWATDWRVKKRNRRIILAVVAIAAITAFVFGVRFLTEYMTRTLYSSEQEMRAALQGRFESDYAEDIEIIGDDIIVTYYERSHYDLEYAKKYGYSEYGDSVYEDTVEEWDYRHGRIKCRWMSDMTIDRKGRIVQYGEVFTKTNAPRPTPIDPSLLDGNGGSSDLSEEDQAAQDEHDESLEATEEAAAEAGVLAGDSDD